MKKVYILAAFGLFVAVTVFVSITKLKNFSTSTDEKDTIVSKVFQTNDGGPDQKLHSFAIEAMREREYSGSDIVIEQELEHGGNYSRYIASYKSEGLKIFGLLTIPDGPVPRNPKGEVGWSAIIFNHGYIPPDQYVTTQKYVEYLDSFAKNGYVVFKPDYRGHGNSEGNADGNYFSPGYVVDVLNAVSSIKQLKSPSTGHSTLRDEPSGSGSKSSGSIVNADRIGMWGHSMGGNITMKNLVITDDIKAAVIWAGVVGSYDDILNNWSRAGRWQQSAEHRHQGPNRQNFLEEYGSYEENFDFWRFIDPYTYLGDINTPIQLHHGTADTHVPLSFSENFKVALDENNKPVEFYSYEDADHNLSGSAFSPAMKRSVEFFDKYLK